MNERELIVYATPTGALADQCATYFARAEELGGTTAQTYPPHCTLTGFFRRRPDRVPAIVDCVTEHIASTAHPPQGAVTVVGLRQLDDWIGLELDSSWLIDWTSRLAEHMPVEADEDALRRKTWLHLSLAYGADDLAPYRAPAEQLVDAAADAQWLLGLWERTETDWRRLTPA